MLIQKCIQSLFKNWTARQYTKGRQENTHPSYTQSIIFQCRTGFFFSPPPIASSKGEKGIIYIHSLKNNCTVCSLHSALRTPGFVLWRQTALCRAERFSTASFGQSTKQGNWGAKHKQILSQICLLVSN